MDENNVPEMRPTFEEIRKVDDNGKEYWSSRELCNAMGYSGYWKFQNVIDKAIKVCLIREKVVTFRMVKLNMLLSIFLITK